MPIHLLPPWWRAFCSARRFLSVSINASQPPSASTRALSSSASCRRSASRSHSAGTCGAAAGTDFLGLDIEEVAPRHPGWYRDYFTPAEREGRDEAAMTGLWAAKEALFKALGLGLSCDTLDADLSGPGPVLKGRALARWEELGRPPFALERFDPGPGLQGRLVWGR